MSNISDSTLMQNLKGDGDQDEDSDRDLHTQKKQMKYTFATDDDGFVILPDPDEEPDMKLAQMEQLIRAFIAGHYSKPHSSCVMVY